MATCRITWLAVLVVVLLPASRADAAWTATQEADCQVEIPDTQPHLRVTWDGGCRQGKVEGRGLLSFSNGGRIEGTFRAGQPLDAKGQAVISMPDNSIEMRRVAYVDGTFRHSPLIDDPDLMRVDLTALEGFWDWQFLQGDCREFHHYDESGAARVQSRLASVDYLVQLFAVKRPGHWMALVRTATGGNGQSDCVDVALRNFGETRRLYLLQEPAGALRVCMQPDESTCVAILKPATRSLITSSVGRASGGMSLPSESNGSREPRSAIDIAFDRNKGALYALYGRALRTNDKLAGKVVFEISLSAEGEVTDCRIVSSELLDPELERKLVARIRLIRFGPQPAPATFRKSFDFFPAA